MITDHIFGWKPMRWMKRAHYNSIIGITGLAILAETWWQFWGMVLVLEAILVSIEGCWTVNKEG